ncbi:MAG: hypothetical protein QOG72_183 [Sphingomonadales bacterium]|jgi:hypothetical protein|nr:hypothetical protein [Sphingomonadales bacterium]
MSDIRPEPGPAQPAGGFQNVLSHFWGFEKLLGGTLVRIVYYIGLVGIALYVLIALVSSLGVLAYSPAMGLGGILLTLVGAVFALVFWRVTCELWLIVFKTFDRLGEIRDRLPPR